MKFVVSEVMQRGYETEYKVSLPKKTKQTLKKVGWGLLCGVLTLEIMILRNHDNKEIETPIEE